MPVSVKKHSSGEENPLEERLSEHQIKGWRAVFAAGLHDQGSRERIICFTDTGSGDEWSGVGWSEVEWSILYGVA